MILIAFAILLSPINGDLDISSAFGGISAANPPLVLPCEGGTTLFSFGELPAFFRYDISTKKKTYTGEKLLVATFKGPTVRVKTISQTGIRGVRQQLVGGHPAAAKPIAAISRDKLLVLAASGGMYPIDKKTQQPRRVFAISIVRLDERGSNPNSDYLLPRDDYGWYEAIDSRADAKSGVIDVLVAHTRGRDAWTQLEVYRIVGNKMARIPDMTGRYAKLTGRSFKVWPSVGLARGEWPYSTNRMAVRPSDGLVAYVGTNKIRVGSRTVAVPNAVSVVFIGSQLFAGTRSNPNMSTVSKTFRWDASTQKFRPAGDYFLAGAGTDRFVVKFFPATSKYVLAKL
jgi:hypothetical protein